MNIVKPLRPETITSVAKVLADTETGLKGNDIELILKSCQIPDIEPGAHSRGHKRHSTRREGWRAMVVPN